MQADEVIRVEVVFGTATRQVAVPVKLPVGATVGDAVKASDIAATFPEYDFYTLKTGVWNEVRASNHALKDGDRVEIYRPLVTDPKEARRRRAERRQG